MLVDVNSAREYIIKIIYNIYIYILYTVNINECKLSRKLYLCVCMYVCMYVPQ